MSTIEEFREKVMDLKPGNFMSMQGGSSGILGATTGGGDAILQLQRSVIEFTKLYQHPKAEDQLQVAHNDVVGKIMLAGTLDAISEQRADDLMDMLAELMKGRQ